MNITRKLAIKILKYLNENNSFYFPFIVVCKEYSLEDDDFVEIEPSEWNVIDKDRSYKTFQLWENLVDLRENTTELLAKGFIERITKKSIETEIEYWAKKYRKIWNKKPSECKKTEEYELNEFINGKAEGFEESLEIIKKYTAMSK